MTERHLHSVGEGFAPPDIATEPKFEQHGWPAQLRAMASRLLLEGVEKAGARREKERTVNNGSP